MVVCKPPSKISPIPVFKEAVIPKKPIVVSLILDSQELPSNQVFLILVWLLEQSEYPGTLDLSR